MQVSHLKHIAEGACSVLRQQVIGKKYSMKVAGMKIPEIVTVDSLDITVSDVYNLYSPDYMFDLYVGVSEQPEWLSIVLKCLIRRSSLVGNTNPSIISEIVYKAILEAFEGGFKAVPDTELARILYGR